MTKGTPLLPLYYIKIKDKAVAVVNKKILPVKIQDIFRKYLGF